MPDGADLDLRPQILYTSSISGSSIGAPFDVFILLFIIGNSLL